MTRIPFNRMKMVEVLGWVGMIIFSLASLLQSTEVYGQTLDCERLSRIKSFNASFKITGNGEGQGEGQLGDTQFTTKQSFTGSVMLKALEMPPGLPISPCTLGSISWIARDFPSTITIEDSHKRSCTPNGNAIHTYKGSGNPEGNGLVLSINFFDSSYSFSVEGFKQVTISGVNCDGSTDTPTDVPYGFGPQTEKLGGSRTISSSTFTFSGSRRFRDMRTHPVDWEISWHFSPSESVDCPSYREGSIIACENQALGEDVGIVGTPFFLHYQSDRVLGRVDADLPAIAHANQFAGWTLNAHHAYHMEGNVLYLGNGGRRSGDELGRVQPTNTGDFIIADESGSAVYVFNSKGLHSETRDGLTGNVLYRFDYNSSGQLIAVTDRDANVTKVERAPDGKPTAIVAPFGQRTLLTLDSSGYLASITNPAGESVALSLSPNGLLTNMTDAKGNVHHFKYDDDGRLIEDKDPSGHTQTLSRSENANGYTAKLVTAENRATSYAVENGPTGKRRVRTSPGGLQSVSMKDFDRKEDSSMPDGTKTTRTVEADPRFGMQSPRTSTTVTMPSGLVSTVTKSRVANLTDPANPFSFTILTDTVKVNGQSYINTYDRTTSTFTAVTPEGRQTKTTLDAKGRVSQNQVAAFLPTQYTYDNQGRLKTFSQGTGGANRTTTLDYNNAGFLESITDPLGRVRKSSFDAAGRLTSETLPESRTIRYAYDKNDNVTGVTPPGRPEHKFTYTQLDLPSSYVPPDILPGSEETTNSYNADRQLKKVVRPDGQTLDLSYDASGRLKSLTSSVRMLNYGYDPTTRKLTTIAASEGSGLSFNYDGALLTEEKWSGPIIGTIGRSYDNDFRPSSLRVNGSNAINLQYDNDGLLIKAGDLTIARDAQSGLIKGTTIGSLTDKWSYDEFGELKGYRSEGLYTVEYDRDKLGRIIEMRETIGDVTAKYSYDYDLAGRLHKVQKDGNPTAAYAYDSNGNRTSFTNSVGTINGVYDDQDRLTQYGNTSYTYTANGELLSKTLDSETTKYRYDALGNLIEVTLPDGKQITYIVDGRNRRIGKQINGAKVQGFLYQDGLRPIAELDGNNNVVSLFVYATGRNVPDYMMKGGVPYRIITDHLGSPRLVVNATSGQIVQRLNYDEFGRVLNDTNPAFQPFGFGGGLHESITKLIHLGAREYSPEIGRWLTREPLLFKGRDSNLYRYAFSDPINLSDTNGLRVQQVSENLNGYMEAIARSPTGKALLKAIEQNPNPARIFLTNDFRIDDKGDILCGETTSNPRGITLRVFGGSHHLLNYTRDVMHTLAHELVHVRQQGEDLPWDEELREKEADAYADQILRELEESFVCCPMP